MSGCLEPLSLEDTVGVVPIWSDASADIWPELCSPTRPTCDSRLEFSWPSCLLRFLISHSPLSIPRSTMSSRILLSKAAPPGVLKLDAGSRAQGVQDGGREI